MGKKNYHTVFFLASSLNIRVKISFSTRALSFQNTIFINQSSFGCKDSMASPDPSVFLKVFFISFDFSMVFYKCFLTCLAKVFISFNLLDFLDFPYSIQLQFPKICFLALKISLALVLDRSFFLVYCLRFT